MNSAMGVVWDCRGQAVAALLACVLAVTSAQTYYMSSSCPGGSTVYTSQYTAVAATSGSTYSPGMSCAVILYGSPTVILTLTQFSTVSGYDYLYIYDGSSSGSTQLAALTGAMPSQIAYQSSTGYMYLLFTSSSSSPGSTGFLAPIASTSTYYMSNSCQDASYVYLSQYNTLALTSASSYNNNMNCAVILVGTTTVTISFSSFSTESGYDFVYLYDGSSSSYTQLARLSGSSLSTYTYTSSQQYMYVKFTSDSSNTATGFTAALMGGSSSGGCMGSQNVVPGDTVTVNAGTPWAGCGCVSLS